MIKLGLSLSLAALAAGIIIIGASSQEARAAVIFLRSLGGFAVTALIAYAIFFVLEQKKILFIDEDMELPPEETEEKNEQSTTEKDEETPAEENEKEETDEEAAPSAEFTPLSGDNFRHIKATPDT